MHSIEHDPKESAKAKARLEKFIAKFDKMFGDAGFKAEISQIMPNQIVMIRHSAIPENLGEIDINDFNDGDFQNTPIWEELILMVLEEGKNQVRDEMKRVLHV